MVNPYLLLECPRGCRWQVKDTRDRPSQPCQDSCVKSKRITPDEICHLHERQVQNVQRLVTCSHAKPGVKKPHLYNGKVSGRSDTPFPGVPYPDGTYPAEEEEGEEREEMSGLEEDEEDLD